MFNSLKKKIQNLTVSNILNKINLNKDIYKIYLVAFVANLQFFGAISMTFFIDIGHLNYKNIFILESFYTLFLFITEIPNGILADKFSRKKAICVGLILLGSGYLIFGLSKSFNVFIVAELFCAFGAAFLSGADKALLYELLIKQSLETKAKKYFARMQSWGILGMAIGLPLGSLLSTSNLFHPYPQSLSVTFILSAISCFIVAITALSIKEKEVKKHTKNFIKIGYESCIYIVNNKKLFSLCLNLVLINAPVFFIIWLYQPLLTKSNLDLKYFGIVACLFNLVSIFFLRHIDRLERMFGIKNLLFYSGLLPGIIFIILSFVTNVIPCIILIVISASIKSIRAPIIGDYINNEIGNENRATILSAISMFQRLIILFLNPVIGYFCDISINYALCFLGIFIIIICLYFRKNDSFF